VTAFLLLQLLLPRKPRICSSTPADKQNNSGERRENSLSGAAPLHSPPSDTAAPDATLEQQPKPLGGVFSASISISCG
jgi:hypothetical protein